MKIKMGLLESYTAGFLPLRIPASATLVVEFPAMPKPFDALALDKDDRSKYRRST